MAEQTDTKPRRRDRIVRKIASLIVLAVYRKVDIYRPDVKAPAGPLMSVSNHFGGFADPLLLVYASQRMPRIIARDVIWKIPIAGWVMKWLGAIPVHKPEDRGAGSNDVMFASAYTALEEGSHLMIFPEGITRDEPSIAPIKTGAARIALGARTRGAEGIHVIPAGIHYEDKASLRSDVSLQIGYPFAVESAVSEHLAPGADPGPDNRDLVRALTDDIEVRLRRVAPDFADWEEAQAMTRGAEVLIRTLADEPSAPVPLGPRDALAGHLGRKPPEVKERVLAALEDYDAELSGLRLSDAELLSGMTGRRFLWTLLGWLVLSIVLFPFALVGAVINWIPYLIVKAVGLLRAAPAVMATIKPMTAILAFGIAWAVAIWGAFRNFGVEAAALAILLLPLYFGAVIVFTEGVVRVWNAFRTWLRLRSASDSGDVIAERRADVVDVLVEAL